ncbi:hypothetical protein BDV09DRAFT_201607 [Aspergillus tetrazonus]
MPDLYSGPQEPPGTRCLQQQNFLGQGSANRDGYKSLPEQECQVEDGSGINQLVKALPQATASRQTPIVSGA